MSRKHFKQSAVITRLCIVCTYLLAMLLLATAVNAQLKGSHLLSDAGLQSGTQAPPSISVFVPLYFYHTSTFKNSDGHEISPSPDFNMFATGIGTSVVTNFKILHGNWGASLFIPFASNKIDGSQVYSKSSFAFSDIYVQPVQLGWNGNRADFTAGYALYIPTGKYAVGGDGNSGMGMLSNEFSGGTTIYLDKNKSFNFSALLSYALNGKKKDSEIKTGDVLSIEGGLGKTFYKPVQGSETPMVFNAGLVYYMQFKATDDKIPVGNTIFTGNKDHIYALGAEGNVMLAKTFTVFGIRWLGELGASNRFQGNAFFVSIAQPLKSLEKKKA